MCLLEIAGFSKFLSGVAGAKASPRVVLAAGLMATALVNLAFGFGASYAWFLVCWGANGLLQVGRELLRPVLPSSWASPACCSPRLPAACSRWAQVAHAHAHSATTLLKPE